MKMWMIPVILSLALIGAYLGLRDNLESWSQEWRMAQQRVATEQFELADSDGKSFRFSDLRGQWVVVFFGYTHCPDICPMSLSYANREYRHLASSAEKVKVVFVSIDPARDREAVSKFVGHFNPQFLGITASDTVLQDLTGLFQTGYTRDPSTSQLGYLMSHSADFFILDPTGLLIDRVHAPHVDGQLSGILRKLMQGDAS